MNKKKTAITAGDFNGIGPEVVVKALNKLNPPSDDVVLIGSKKLFSRLNKEYEIVEIPFDENWLKYGHETKEGGKYSYLCLQKACDLAKEGVVKNIVTAPLSKNAMHLAGYNFSGQTEVLEMNFANEQKSEKAEMLFTSGDFRVLLLTRHVPLREVKITKELLIEKIKRISAVLNKDYNIETPKIALCSLNPHAGENGLLGRDEIEELVPAAEFLQKSGFDITKPLPADTLFAKAAKAYLQGEKQPYDVYCACYHDQGLIPIKTLAMNKTVNTTVGLSVFRTSPAHGTAYDIAGKLIADETSMICAIKEALSK